MSKVDLINGDCMEFMAGCDDNAYDLAIVDPPYGVGMSGGNVGYKGNNNFERKEWDNEIPSAEYFSELMRVSKTQIIWGGNYFPLPPSRCFIVWDKGAGFKGRTYAEGELAWCSLDANAKIFKYDPLCNGDYKGKINPCQKPISLYKWLLDNYATEGNKILDTFGGSMSSVIACIDMEYDVDCVERDSDYFKAACERVQTHVNQLDMFIPVPIININKEQQ